MTKREKLFVFDIGNVFVKLDPVSRDRAVARSDDPSSSKRYRDVPRAVFRDFCRGHMAEADYVQALTEIFGVGSDAVYAAEHAYVAESFAGFIDVVRALKERHRVVCLSNNQTIHWRYINDNILKPGYFDREYLSQNMGLEKPDPEIFRALTEAEDCAGKDVVFVDDIEENILAARAAGWQHCIHHVDPNETARMLEAIASDHTTN
ncbi:HAD-IA family hydrolase [Rhizobium sp. XQZ8]|uniref:HAD-IA family hydrolase n=1 Tax=Rhizobium populisoli TaxID=2859785 RepID=UPI001CA5C618|nr:HAD-IA family hydrolase [Rhizobium populisoli]MBW6424152.1 HAD-IA family hydrolase [Rhizobium populisoli]